MESFDALWEIYEARCAFGGVPIQDFVVELAEGQHGRFEAETVVKLLEKLLASVLENIDMMAESNPALLEVVDEKKEEHTHFYRELIVKVRDNF